MKNIRVIMNSSYICYNQKNYNYGFSKRKYFIIRFQLIRLFQFQILDFDFTRIIRLDCMLEFVSSYSTEDLWLRWLNDKTMRNVFHPSVNKLIINSFPVWIVISTHPPLITDLCFQSTVSHRKSQSHYLFPGNLGKAGVNGMPHATA